MGSRTRRERSASKSCVMDRRTPLALLETRGRLITEATYFPSLLEGCAAQTLSASGLQAPVSNVRFGSEAAIALASGELPESWLGTVGTALVVVPRHEVAAFPHEEVEVRAFVRLQHVIEI